MMGKWKRRFQFAAFIWWVCLAYSAVFIVMYLGFRECMER